MTISQDITKGWESSTMHKTIAFSVFWYIIAFSLKLFKVLACENSTLHHKESFDDESRTNVA